MSSLVNSLLRLESPEAARTRSGVTFVLRFVSPPHADVPHPVPHPRRPRQRPRRQVCVCPPIALGRSAFLSGALLIHAPWAVRTGYIEKQEDSLPSDYGSTGFVLHLPVPRKRRTDERSSTAQPPPLPVRRRDFQLHQGARAPSLIFLRSMMSCTVAYDLVAHSAQWVTGMGTLIVGGTLNRFNLL